MDEIRRDATASRTSSTDVMVKRHNKQTHFRQISFDIGYFALVSQRLDASIRKHCLKRRDSCLVFQAVSDLVLEIKNLIFWEDSSRARESY